MSNLPDRVKNNGHKHMLIELWRKMDGHSANFNIKYKKIPNSSNNWTKKYIRRAQQQNKWGSRTNQWAGRQNNGTHPDRAAKWKKNFKKERYIMGLLGQHPVW